jgi:hypothetical protein
MSGTHLLLCHRSELKSRKNRNHSSWQMLRLLQMEPNAYLNLIVTLCLSQTCCQSKQSTPFHVNVSEPHATTY